MPTRVALCLLLCIVGFSVASPWLPQDSGWLGRDRMGRDIVVMLAQGGRYSLGVGVAATALAGAIGVVLGAAAGYWQNTRLKLRIGEILLLATSVFLLYFYGFYLRLWAITGFLLLANGLLGIAIARLPWLRTRIALPVDSLLQFCMAILTAVPSLLLFVALAAVLPSSPYALVLLIGGTGWVGVARLVRGEVMRVQQQTHVAAAQGLGLSPLRIVRRHILPLALAPLWAILGLAVGNVILAESALSFLHIGVPDDVHTWGKMLASARSQHHGWQLAIFPGLAIFLTVWAINSLADRFR